MYTAECKISNELYSTPTKVERFTKKILAIPHRIQSKTAIYIILIRDIFLTEKRIRAV